MAENTREWVLERRESSRFATRMRERSAIRARMREASTRQKAVHRLERKQAPASLYGSFSAKGGSQQSIFRKGLSAFGSSLKALDIAAAEATAAEERLSDGGTPHSGASTPTSRRLVRVRARVRVRVRVRGKVRVRVRLRVS